MARCNTWREKVDDQVAGASEGFAAGEAHCVGSGDDGAAGGSDGRVRVDVVALKLPVGRPARRGARKWRWSAWQCFAD